MAGPLLRHSRRTAHTVCAVVILLSLTVPLLIPTHAVLLRFIAACLMVELAARVYDIHKADCRQRTFRQYCFFLLPFPPMLATVEQKERRFTNYRPRRRDWAWVAASPFLLGAGMLVK